MIFNGLNEYREEDFQSPDEPSEESDKMFTSDEKAQIIYNMTNTPEAAEYIQNLRYDKTITLFDIKELSIEEINENMKVDHQKPIPNQYKMINYFKLSIMKEIDLFEEIADIYKCKHQDYILNKILFYTKFKPIKLPIEIYESYIDNYPGFSNDYDEEYYESLSNIDKKLYLKDLIRACRYLMLNMDPLKKDFITDYDFYRSEYLFDKLENFKDIKNLEFQITLDFNFNRNLYPEYRFTDDLKKRIKNFIDKNSNANVDAYFSSFINDIYSLNVDDIKKKMNIDHYSLFKEDVLSLNKDIPEELMKQLYKDHIPIDLQYIYKLKANRISFMAKYKNIIYGLKLDKKLYIDKSRFFKNTFGLEDYTILRDNTEESELDEKVKSLEKTKIDNPNDNTTLIIKNDDTTNNSIFQNVDTKIIVENDNQIETPKKSEEKSNSMINQKLDYPKVKSNSHRRELRHYALNKLIKKSIEEDYDAYKKLEDDLDRTIFERFKTRAKNSLLNKKGLNSK